MRLHALIFALFVLGAHTASIPDKKDIEKKLAQVVKEVLNKDEVPIDNVSSAQELIEQTDDIKDVENNLRKSAQPSDIPVKVVVEDVQPALKTDEKKENNEVSPTDVDSDEIVREEIDLKNPGPPQRMQHDTQNPETFVDALKSIVVKNSEWRQSQPYDMLQKEIKDLKENFENRMTELYTSIQQHWNTHPEEVNDVQKEEENIKVRASVRDETSSSSSGSDSSNSTGQWGSGPVASIFQNWAQQFQTNLQNLNQTVNNYWNNSTNSNSTSSSSNDCSSGSGSNLFNWGNNNPLNFGQQQGTGQQQQSDEPARPGIWQTVQQNVQNFFQGGSQQPAGAQSDTQQPAQPNRPVMQAFQSVIQQAGNLFNRPGQSETQQPIPVTTPVTQEGANAVPASAETKPDAEKQPEQATPQPQQSGPIKQMIGNNPVVQGIAGAVQRIQHTINPSKPREDAKDAGADKEAQATKGGFFPPPPPPHRKPPRDNIDVSGSRVEEKDAPEVPQNDAPGQPTKEDSLVQDKTE